MSEWMPMDTAPRDGTPVLLAIHDCGDPKLPLHYAVAHFEPEDGEWHRSAEEFDTTWPPVCWQPIVPPLAAGTAREAGNG